jgi:branched-chain amino acid transport system substrate-binding protein
MGGNIVKRIALPLLSIACLALWPSVALADDGQAFRIGVLDDLSSSLADQQGPGDVVAAKMAVEDFGGKVLGRPIEILSADHQNKPDSGLLIVRQWYERDNVQAIVGLGIPASRSRCSN